MERRLAAIMMLDFIGYGRLAEADERAALDLLKELRHDLIEPAAKRTSGKILKLMGDGMMLEFPSLVSALDCGLEIQSEISHGAYAEEARPIGFRIGVNLCDLIQDEGDVYGEDVNVAARLEQSAPRGAVRITSDAFRQVRHKIDANFVQRGALSLKNVREPIGICDVFPKGTEPEPQASDAAAPEGGGERSATATKPSIAVLPLDNLSGREEEDYFSEGISEDIITELSKFHSIDVLARHSSFAFKGQSLTIPEIGAKLGVDYVVEGSVRRIGPRLRLVAQLINAESGRHVWAEYYDEDIEKIFDVEDEIVSKIVGQLESNLLQEHLRHSARKTPTSAKPYDLWLKAKKLMEAWTPEGDAEAETLLLEAVAMDPSFARAHGGLAGIYNSRSLLMPGYEEVAQARRLGMEHAARAVELDPKDGQNHIHKAWCSMLAGQFQRGAKHFELAESMNPNDASILIARALAYAFLGEPSKGERLAARAMDLDPLFPDYYLGNLAVIQFIGGRYEDCLETIAAAPAAFPEISGWRAAAYAHAGREDEARAAAEVFRRSTRERWCGPAGPSDKDMVDWLLSINPFTREQDRDALLEGLRKAGLEI